MNFTIYTLSFDFEDKYKIVIGYRILGMKKNELLYVAYTYENDWKHHRHYLGEYEKELNDPEEMLHSVFYKFLETLRVHFKGEKHSLRRESSGWKIKEIVYHELTPSKIEPDALDKTNVIKRVDYIAKLCSF